MSQKKLIHIYENITGKNRELVNTSQHVNISPNKMRNYREDLKMLHPLATARKNQNGSPPFGFWRVFDNGAKI
jgi:hypothetical protein